MSIMSTSDDIIVITTGIHWNILFGRQTDRYLCLWYIFVSISKSFFFGGGSATQRWAWAPHSWGFLDHTQQRTTVGRTPLEEWSARLRDLYLTTQTLTTDKHPCPGWDSNPRSQQESGRRPTPQTAWLLGPASYRGYTVQIGWMANSWIKENKGGP